MGTKQKANVILVGDIEQAKRDMLDIVRDDVTKGTPAYDMAKGIQLAMQTMQELKHSTDLPFEIITAFKDKAQFTAPRVRVTDLETFDATVQLIIQSVHSVLEHSEMDSRSKSFVFKVIKQALLNIGGNHE